MLQQDVFNLAMPLIDETPVNGVFDIDNTEEYTAKAPFILTIIQSELCKVAPLYKNLTITASGTEGYVAVTMPSDYMAIYKLLDSDLENFDDFKIVNKTIYVPYDFSGTLVYRYIPAMVEVLTEECPFDDITASTAIPHYLASRLIAIEKPDLSRDLFIKAEDYKRNIKTQQPASISKRKDKYGASCKF